MVGCEGAFGRFKFDVRRTALALIGGLWMGLLGSCSGRSTLDGDGARGGGPTGPVSESDFLPKVVDVVCGNVGACCAAAGIPYDRAGCEAFVSEGAELEPPPNATWDSVEAGKCIDWFERIVASCSEASDGDKPCLRVYRGTLPEGAACVDSPECADIRGSEATCRYDDFGVSGTCTLAVEAPRGVSGDPCTGTCSGGDCGFSGDAFSRCHVEDGVVCSFDLGVCVSVPAVGEPCDDLYCAAGAYCSSLRSICEAKKPDGARCELNEECTNGSCANFVCGPNSLASSELCNGT